MPASKSSLRRRRIGLIMAGVAIAALFAIATRWGGGSHWRDAINSLSPVALLIGLALLPLTGFPVMLLLLAVGARFGFWPGLGAASAMIGVHLALSFPLSKFVRKPVTALLKKAGWTLPKLDRRSSWSFAVWLALVPGLSYTIKNYTPPLAGVPFSIYFLSYYPVHVATAVIGLLLGGATMNFSWPLVIAGLVYAIVLGTLTRVLARRLRESRDSALASSSPDGSVASGAA